MSRYTGPRLRLMRALGVELPGLSRKSTERRPYPPGQHRGESRRKPSVYAQQLREKQKLRFNYGVSERQLRRFVREAFRKKGDPGENLLQILERRLDSVVFRAGFAPTIPAARQLISHGHVLIGGKRVDIASYLVRVGDVLTMSGKGSAMPLVVGSLEKPALARPHWLSFDEATKAARIGALPDRETFPFPIEVEMIVEYYTQRT